MTSFLLSVPVAMSATESILFPSPMLNMACQTLIAMAATSTATVAVLNTNSSGCITFPADERKSCTPTTIMSTETRSPVRYSIRACP